MARLVWLPDGTAHKETDNRIVWAGGGAHKETSAAAAAGATVPVVNGGLVQRGITDGRLAR